MNRYIKLRQSESVNWSVREEGAVRGGREGVKAGPTRLGWKRGPGIRGGERRVWGKKSRRDSAGCFPLFPAVDLESICAQPARQGHGSPGSARASPPPCAGGAGVALVPGPVRSVSSPPPPGLRSGRQHLPSPRRCVLLAEFSSSSARGHTRVTSP